MNDSVFVAVGLGRYGGVKEGLTDLLIFEYILKAYEGVYRLVRTRAFLSEGTAYLRNGNPPKGVKWSVVVVQVQPMLS